MNAGSFEQTFQHLADIFKARKPLIPEIQSVRFQALKISLVNGWTGTGELAKINKSDHHTLYNLLHRLRPYISLF